MLRFNIIICVWLTAQPLATAGLKLADVFTNHAVIQAGKPVTVWGTSDAGKKVTVRLAEVSQAVTTDTAGNWRAIFKPVKASYRAFALTVATESVTITRENLVAGEVWIATGQSNMKWMLKDSTGGKEELKSCADPHLRLLLHEGTLHPDSKKYSRDFLTQLNCENYYRCGGWQTCTENSAAHFSAVAYFFGKMLREKLDVPVGIIALPVGGSPIEAHLPEDAFTSDQKLKPLLREWWKNPDYPQWCRQRAALNISHWLADPEQGKDPPHPFAPTFLWQAGIDPLLQYPVKGIIWYQGESNATLDRGPGKATPKEVNHRKLVALVNAYRRHWKDETLPFYHVQLPGLNRPWALFREMQHDVTKDLKNVGMAVTIDLGHPSNVHPPDKKPVGDRLARLALHQTYGKPIACRGPEPDNHVIHQGAVTITFIHAVGLATSDGKSPRAFELAGADDIFHPAKATISEDKVVISSAKVGRPTAIRYAWANNPDSNLINAAGLPAAPFRLKF
ncbi:MAG: hypothetical protein H7A51_19930 [Akkermansiaceae bacterium]|nr:hypothetical protein [Akkermansiaceae bacterium]